MVRLKINGKQYIKNVIYIGSFITYLFKHYNLALVSSVVILLVTKQASSFRPTFLYLVIDIPSRESEESSKNKDYSDKEIIVNSEHYSIGLDKSNNINEPSDREIIKVEENRRYGTC